MDFVKHLKSSDQWKGIPIFVVSNTASANKVRGYHEMGISKFFTKANFRLDEIISDIISFLDK